MKASILDLRYRMKDVLKALDRNETVEILYHGKTKGILSPCLDELHKKVSDHPFFGMQQEQDETVQEKMGQLRGDRYRDI